MTNAAERIRVLVTTSEKSSIAKMAKDVGLSMGELLACSGFLQPGRNAITRLE